MTTKSLITKELLYFYLFVFFQFSVTHLSAQKVALVLSGGGSKGMAHIGVLKALEENNVPIDYIAGTSIGAMVGGLYASGYSVEEITDLFSSPEFERWSNGEIDQQYRFFYKQDAETPSWVNLKFTGDSITKTYLPTNIVPSYPMDLAFIQILASPAAAADYNFDNLFVPFRCVATDIFNNKPVVFRKGDLTRAVRASMTFPLYFKPITIDGKLLFDGGISNNFPVDVVINDFKPDVIIGVRVAQHDKPSKEDDLMSQLENLVLMRTDYVVPDSNGVLIEPDNAGAGLMDFYLLDTLLKNGYNATVQKMPEIKKLVTRQYLPRQRERDRVKFLFKQPPLRFDSIIISGLKKGQRKYVDKILMKKRKVLTFDELKAEYFKLLAEGTIENIEPQARFNYNTGFFHVKMNLKPAKKLETEVGGVISSHSFNVGYLGLKYRYFSNRAFRLYTNLYYGKLYTSGMAGIRIDFASRIPYVFESFLVYNNWDYVSSNLDMFFDDYRPNYIIQNQSFLKSSLSTAASNNAKFFGEFTFGTNWNKYAQITSFSSTDTLDQSWYYFLQYGIGFQKRTLDFPQYSTNGQDLRIKLILNSYLENFMPGSATIQNQELWNRHIDLGFKLVYDNYNLLLTKKTRIGFHFLMQLTQARFHQNYMASLLTAPTYTPTPHSRTLFLKNYRAYNFAAVGLTAIQHLTENIHFRTSASVFQPYRTIEEHLDSDGRRTAEFGQILHNRFYTFSGALVYHTMVGPLSIDVNFYEKEVNQFYWSLNFGYLIFNKTSNF